MSGSNLAINFSHSLVEPTFLICCTKVYCQWQCDIHVFIYFYLTVFIVWLSIWMSGSNLAINFSHTFVEPPHMLDTSSLSMTVQYSCIYVLLFNIFMVWLSIWMSVSNLASNFSHTFVEPPFLICCTQIHCPWHTYFTAGPFQGQGPEQNILLRFWLK